MIGYLEIWFGRILNKRSVSRGYIDIIKDMYASVRTTCCETSELQETVGLHYGLALRLFSFALIRDELNTLIH